MSTNNKITKVVVTFDDGGITVVTPESGHNIVLAIDKGERIAQVVSGKVSELCRLFDALLENNKPIIAIVATARIAAEAKQEHISDKTFRDLPVGGNA